MRTCLYTCVQISASSDVHVPVGILICEESYTCVFVISVLWSWIVSMLHFNYMYSVNFTKEYSPSLYLPPPLSLSPSFPPPFSLSLCTAVMVDPGEDPEVVPQPVVDSATGDDGITHFSATVGFTLPAEIEMNGPVDRSGTPYTCS